MGRECSCRVRVYASSEIVRTDSVSPLFYNLVREFCMLTLRTGDPLFPVTFGTDPNSHHRQFTRGNPT